MSTTYVPKRKKGVAKTAWSYDNGGFDANVDGGQQLGRVHKVLGLPVDPFAAKSEVHRAPYAATAKEVKAWAKHIREVQRAFRVHNPFIAAWVEFLDTCGGYTTL